MLRASQKITLVSENIEFNNGFVISTSIHLNGLILRADQPIHPIIRDFLDSKNIMVKKIRVTFKPDHSTKGILFPCYEDCIKVYGNFSISKTDVEKFTKSYEYLEALDQTCKNLTQLERSEQLQADIEKEYLLCLEHAEYTDTVHAWNIWPPSMFANQSVFFAAPNYQPETHIIATESIEIRTTRFATYGMVTPFIDGHKRKHIPNTGLMHSFLSKKNIHVQFGNNMHLQDAIMSSENITIACDNNSGRLVLSINKNIDWLNNPYRNSSLLFNPMSKIHRCKFEQKEIKEETELETEDNWISITKIKPHHQIL